MRFALVFTMVAVSGCSKGDRAPAGAAAEAAKTREATAVERHAKPAQVAKPSADIPAWAPIESGNGEPAKPTAWKADSRPTLVIFSASWCPGCTASALADRTLVRAHGKQFQVGVALQESDAAFVASP